MLTTVLCVATPIKIWNNARIEHRLEEQEKLLLTARVEALASQINPHFLFNTLTSIQSLIRTNPETARTVIVKLSGLLRRLLRSRDHFVTLREELESIDEYLDIEVIRFGPQLKVEKQISPDTLDVIVPSMILQPLVENSIKHGFSRKVGGGRIIIRSVRQNGHAIIEVEDDGLGMTEERMDTALTDGIGLSNVNERLSVIYGAAYRVRITSVPNLGHDHPAGDPRHGVGGEDHGVGKRGSDPLFTFFVNMSLKAVVVDDEQLAREELCYMLEQMGSIEVIAPGRQRPRGRRHRRAPDARRPVSRRPDARPQRLRGGAPAHPERHARRTSCS